MKKAIFALVVLVLSSNLFAGEVTGLIDKFDLHADNWSTYNPNDRGVLSIYVEGMPKACGSSGGLTRTVIYTDHPLFSSVFAMVTAAKLTGKPVTLYYLDKCTARTGSWDFGYLSFRG